MSEQQIEEDEGFGLFEENIPSNAEAAEASINDAILSQSIDAESQFITFTIDSEEYGTPILTVQEIRGWMKTTPLPNMPEYVKGVTNLRGNIVPVFDLRARFSGVLTEVTNRHVVIIVEIGGRTIGLLVDAISDILTIDEGQIQPPPEMNTTIESQYLDGLVTADERMVALVNIHKLFDAEILNKVGQQAAA